jgi:predicted  nucleic acid-binding Zn-ribbon protein
MQQVDLQQHINAMRNKATLTQSKRSGKVKTDGKQLSALHESLESLKRSPKVDKRSQLGIAV